MSDVLADLRALSSAEEIFGYFSLPYDPAVLHVNRLHILKRFNQYLAAGLPAAAAALPTPDAPTPDAPGPVAMGGNTVHAAVAAHRALLLRAYEDFVRSTPAREKVFKVFQDAEGGHIGLETLRRTLPSRSAS
jgi:nitrogenase-stabilizing/protective protein